MSRRRIRTRESLPGTPASLAIFREFTIDREPTLREIQPLRAFFGGFAIAEADLSSFGKFEMLKIQRSMADGRVHYSLSGRVEGEQLAELERLLAEEADQQLVVLDLEEVRLVDREAVGFLARCEESGIRLESCPAYVREWIATEKSEAASPPRKPRR